MSDLILIHGCRPLTRALNFLPLLPGACAPGFMLPPAPRGLFNLARSPERSPGLRSTMFTVFEHLNSIHENIFDANR